MTTWVCAGHIQCQQSFEGASRRQGEARQPTSRVNCCPNQYMTRSSLFSIKSLSKTVRSLAPKTKHWIRTDVKSIGLGKAQLPRGRMKQRDLVTMQHAFSIAQRDLEVRAA